MSVKLLTEHHLEVLSLKGGCTGTSESTLVKMPHCWKSHVTAHIFSIFIFQYMLNRVRAIIKASREAVLQEDRLFMDDS